MQLRNTSAGGGIDPSGKRYATPVVTPAQRDKVVNQGRAVGNRYGVDVDPNIPLSVDEIENAFYGGGNYQRQYTAADIPPPANTSPLLGNSAGGTAPGRFPPDPVYPQIPTNRVVTTGVGMDDSQPFIPGMEVPGRTYDGSWDAIKQGASKGFNYAVDGDGIIRTKSIFTDRAPATEYNYLPVEGQAAYAAGRIAADFVGHGSRSFIWGAHPEDFISRVGNKYLAEVPKNMRLPALYATGAAMGIASGNYNPLNFEGGGAAAGFGAISGDPDNPTVSTAPVYDMVVERGAFGRKGKILGWEEFHQQRPDVSFEDYSKYKDYLYNKDENLLRQMTFGLAKATPDGINGPEVNIMGYSVTPAGAAAALGALAGTKYLLGNSAGGTAPGRFPLYKNRMANLL
jgi:hypothetical protein